MLGGTEFASHPKKTHPDELGSKRLYSGAPVGLYSDAPGTVHAGDAVIEEGNMLCAHPELLEDVAIALRLRFAKCNLIREEALIETGGELQLLPKPRDVEFIRIAQAGDGSFLTHLLEKLEGAREGASKPRSELREKGFWSHGEAELLNRASSEVLRRTPPSVEMIRAPRLRPEALEFLSSQTTPGEPGDGLQASEVEEKPGKIKDKSTDRDGWPLTDGA